MTQQRLNHCFILHIHRQKTDNLDLKEIDQEYVQEMKEDKHFFGKYDN